MVCKHNSKTHNRRIEITECGNSVICIICREKRTWNKTTDETRVSVVIVVRCGVVWYGIVTVAIWACAYLGKFDVKVKREHTRRKLFCV